MTSEDKGQSGYYQTIARVFLEHRGAPFFLSPADQSTIAAWEERRIPLRVILEGIGRTFDGLRARGRGGKRISLSSCARQVDAAFAQHKDRSAGRAKPSAPSAGKTDRARREVECRLREFPPEESELTRLLRAALDALSVPKPDEAALERLDAEVESVLWARATAAEKAAAEAEVRTEFRNRRPQEFDHLVRRMVVKASRDARRIPHVSLFYY